MARILEALTSIVALFAAWVVMMLFVVFGS